MSSMSFWFHIIQENHWRTEHATHLGLKNLRPVRE